LASRNGTVLIVGPGPVTLGQGKFTQYLAARACRRLRGKGVKILVLEDNPATLMDVGGEEDDLFIEPPAPEVVERIVERRGPVSLWYSLGGRRGWDLALRMAGEGWHERLGTSTMGSEDRILWLCCDRSLLRETLESRGIANPAFRAAASMREGQDASESIGFPLVVRPHFSCGGWGAGLAYNVEEYPLLLEEAMRESMTGEVLIEEALIGWRKCIVTVLRDREGGVYIPGMLEQVEPLPKHDQDAIMVYPPPSLGKEEQYAMQAMATEVADTLDLMGLAEIKLAIQPEWQAQYVIDVNPWPWRTMPLLETALGVDLLGMHLDLVAGGEISRATVNTKPNESSKVTMAIPRRGYISEVETEGYSGLGCRSSGYVVLQEEDIRGAVAVAGLLLSDGGGETRAAALTALATLARDRRRQADMPGTEKVTATKRLSSICMKRTVGEDAAEGLIFLAGESREADSGFEMEASCLQAISAWRKDGCKAVLYTPDHNMGLFAIEEADDVYLGPMEPRVIGEVADQCDLRDINLHFGGPSALRCAEGLAIKGMEVWEWDRPHGGWEIKNDLERLRAAGLPLVGFKTSRGLEEGKRVAEGMANPIFATIGEHTKAMLYTPQDASSFLNSFEDEEVLWRELREEELQVRVEAVAGLNGKHSIVLWEQVDEPGTCSTDGLAVYPPVYLTSDQSRRATAMAGRIIDVLGWRGNLSMGLSLHKGELYLCDLSRGASANLPFIYRASTLPLAAMGVRAMNGRNWQADTESRHCSAVRMPLLPFNIVADSDILPSPQRRSTGSVMGIACDAGSALAKALWSGGVRPQQGGRALLSVANREKRRAVILARELQEAGYLIMATRGTQHALASSGIQAERADKLREGRPNILDHIRNGRVSIVVNIPRGKHPHSDGFYIRAASARHGIPCITDMEVALALARALRETDPGAWEVCTLGEYGCAAHMVQSG
jgi:carbamoylphosphate synthase large subunit